MPYVTDAVVSGKARMATLTAAGEGGMADLSGFLPNPPWCSKAGNLTFASVMSPADDRKESET